MSDKPYISLLLFHSNKQRDRKSRKDIEFKRIIFACLSKRAVICMFIQGKIPYQYSKVLLSTRALLNLNVIEINDSNPNTM